MAPAQKIGLRERKKRQTHERILQVARELFTSRGYEPTSIADIADGADIAVSTLFGYFPNKAEIFFAGYDDIVDEFVAVIEGRSAGESAIDATVRWHRAQARRHADSSAASWHRHLRRLIDEDPALSALEHERYARAEVTLARAVAEDLGDDPNALRPKLIAATKVALMFTLSRHDTDDPQRAEDLAAYVDDVLRTAADAIASIPLPGAGKLRAASQRG